MAIFPDKSGNSPIGLGVDKRFSSPNRKNAGAPNGSVTPLYAGEIVLDTTGGLAWKATDLTNTGWVQTLYVTA
jgi:hypothetical protein